MSDDSSGSLVDNIIAAAILMYIMYMTLLAIPIIPYFDVILKVVFSAYKPDSFLGKVFTGLAFFVAGMFMLEFMKSAGEKYFYDKSAMYLFLYGQGLILIGLMGDNGHTFFYISGILVALISMGFNESVEIGKYYLIVPGIIALLLSYIIEKKSRPKLKKSYVQYKPIKNNTQITNNVLMRNKLKTIQNANKILQQKDISSFEQVIVDKASSYRTLFTKEELEDIPKAIKKYKSNV